MDGKPEPDLGAQAQAWVRSLQQEVQMEAEEESKKGSTDTPSVLHGDCTKIGADNFMHMKTHVVNKKNMCTITLQGSPRDQEHFEQFCAVLRRMYAKRKYNIIVYNVAKINFLGCVKFVVPFINQVLKRCKSDMLVTIQGTGVVVGSPTSQKLANWLIARFSTGRPRKVFTAAELDDNPGLLKNWLNELPPVSKTVL